MRLNSLFRSPTWTEQNCLDLSWPCRRCEQNWRQDKTFLFCLNPVTNLQLFSLKYVSGLKTWKRTKQDSLVLSMSAVWTSHKRNKSAWYVNKLLLQFVTNKSSRKRQCNPVCIRLVNMQTNIHSRLLPMRRRDIFSRVCLCVCLSCLDSNLLTALTYTHLIFRMQLYSTYVGQIRIPRSSGQGEGHWRVTKCTQTHTGNLL